METSLEPAGAIAAVVPTVPAAGGDPVRVYLARLTSRGNR
jgi:hypothetical protein